MLHKWIICLALFSACIEAILFRGQELQSTGDVLVGVKEATTGYFMGSPTEKGFKKRETAAREDVSRDKIKTINWRLSVGGRQKKKPRNPSPKTGRSLPDAPCTSKRMA